MDNVKRRIIRKEQAFSMIFAIYLFIYASIATMTNKNSVGYISGDLHLVMYYVDQLSFVVGILFNAYFWGRLGKDEHKSMYLKVSGVLFYLGSFIIILYPSAFAFLVLAPVVHFFLGILSGAVHYFVASALLETGLVGRIIAIGASAAYLLQYFVQILADNNLLLLILIIAGGITMILIFKNSWQWMILDCLPTDATVERKILSEKRDQLNTAVILSVLGIVLLSYCDSWLIHKMVETEFKEISAYTWPRLFAIPGYILIEAVGDYKEGRYVNITLFASVLWLIICPVLLSDNASLMLILVIFYIAVGIYMGYMYFKFFTLSPYFGKYGVLYASGGRIIDGTAGVLFSLLPWNEMKTWHIITIGITSVTIMAAAIVRSYILSRESEKTTESEKARESGKSRESEKSRESGKSKESEKSRESEKGRDSDEVSGAGDKDIPGAAGVRTVKNIPEDEGTADRGIPKTGDAENRDISKAVDAEDKDIPEATGYGSVQYVTEIENSSESRMGVLSKISEQYGFTAREQDVFEKLIFTEDSGQEIADALFISRRVLQRHVAAIYEKTGTKSRVGLFRIYHKASMGE